MRPGPPAAVPRASGFWRLSFFCSRTGTAIRSVSTRRAPTRATSAAVKPDAPSASIDANGTIDMATGWSTDLAAGYAYDRQSQSDASYPTGAVTPPGVHEFTGSVAVNGAFGPGTFTLEGSADHTFYEDGKDAAGAVLDQGDRTNTNVAGRLRAGYQMTPTLTPFVEGIVSRRFYARTSMPAASDVPVPDMRGASASPSTPGRCSPARLRSAMRLPISTIRRSRRCRPSPSTAGSPGPQPNSPPLPSTARRRSIPRTDPASSGSIDYAGVGQCRLRLEAERRPQRQRQHRLLAHPGYRRGGHHLHRRPRGDVEAEPHGPPDGDLRSRVGNQQRRRQRLPVGHRQGLAEAAAVAICRSSSSRSSAASSSPRLGPVEREGDVRRRDTRSESRSRRCGRGSGARRTAPSAAERDHGVGQLDFVAGAALLAGEVGEDARLKDVAAVDDRGSTAPPPASASRPSGDAEGVLADASPTPTMP